MRKVKTICIIIGLACIALLAMGCGSISISGKADRRALREIAPAVFECFRSDQPEAEQAEQIPVSTASEEPQPVLGNPYIESFIREHSYDPKRDNLADLYRRADAGDELAISRLEFAEERARLIAWFYRVRAYKQLSDLAELRGIAKDGNRSLKIAAGIDLAVTEVEERALHERDLILSLRLTFYHAWLFNTCDDSEVHDVFEKHRLWHRRSLEYGGAVQLQRMRQRYGFLPVWEWGAKRTDSHSKSK